MRQFNGGLDTSGIRKKGGFSHDQGSPKSQEGWQRGDFLFVLRHVRFSWLFILLAVAANIAGKWPSSQLPDQTAQLFDGSFDSARLWGVILTTLLATFITLATRYFQLIATTESMTRCSPSRRPFV